MARQSRIPPPQRAELVLAVLRGTEKLEVQARRHQVSTNTLRRWRDEFIAGGRERLTGSEDASTAAAENKRLARELAERELIIGGLTVANRPRFMEILDTLEGRTILHTQKSRRGR